MMLKNFRFKTWVRSDGIEFSHLFCHLEIDGDLWDCLVDTGSDISIVVSDLAKSFVKKSGFKIEPPIKVKSSSFFGKKHQLTEFTMDGHRFTFMGDFSLDQLNQTYNANVDFLIGNNILKKEGVILDYSVIP